MESHEQVSEARAWLLGCVQQQLQHKLCALVLLPSVRPRRHAVLEAGSIAGCNADVCAAAP